VRHLGLVLCCGSLAVFASACASASPTPEPSTGSTSAAPSSSATSPTGPVPTPSLVEITTPPLIGMPLGAAQSRASGEGMGVQPSRVGGGPVDANCKVIDQMPKPGQPTTVPYVNVLVECGPAAPPPMPAPS